jgi:hypothetical protein
MDTVTPKTAPQILRDRADSIERNGNEAFGGCFVVIPPEGGGEPVDVMVLDRRHDLAFFWNSVISKCQFELAAVEQQQRSGQGFGRR